MKQHLYAMLDGIQPVDEACIAPARQHLDNLTKPQGSLGRLEDLAVELYCMAKGQTPLLVDPVRLFTVAGDHGVVEEGVSAFPRDVTRQMVHNFLQGGAAVNILSRVFGADLLVVDAGCAGGAFPEHPRLIQRKVAEGTANFVLGPAMTEPQCLEALRLGLDLASQAAREGYRCLGIGEMGIGNTTPATALFAAFLRIAPAALAGPGTGLDRHGVHQKALVVQRALNTNTRAVSSGDPLAILCALGGLEIAAMAGIVLGAAKAGLPCLIDGFIAQAACLAALRLCPAAGGYVIFTHTSAEPGSAMILPALGRTPLLSLGLRLGEGTGCALAIPLLRAAVSVFNDMATFAQAGVQARKAENALAPRRPIPGTQTDHR